MFINNGIGDPYSLNLADAVQLNSGERYYLTEPLTTCRSMFFALTWDEANSQMVWHNSNIETIDVSDLDISNVSNMYGMFECCNSLTEIIWGDFDTSKVTDMGRMFQSCSSISSLDLSGFDCSSVTEMEYMFKGCTSLEYLNLANFPVLARSFPFDMFDGCSTALAIDTNTDFMDYCMESGGSYNVSFNGGLKGRLSGYEYISLGLPSGLKWTTENGCGYNIFCWSALLSNPNTCQFEGKSYDDLLSDGAIDSNGNLVSTYDPIVVRYGSPMRMPSKADFEELMNNCAWSYADEKWIATGPNGYSISFSKIPYSTEDFSARGYRYWTSTAATSFGQAYYFNIDESDNKIVEPISIHKRIAIRTVVE